MRVQWATNEKAMSASDKHFNGKLTAADMNTLARKVIMNATHTGTSDRSNGSYAPAKIVWGIYNNTTFAVVLDSKDITKGIATVVSFYDLNPTTINTKATRFGMKKVG